MCPVKLCNLCRVDPNVIWGSQDWELALSYHGDPQLYVLVNEPEINENERFCYGRKFTSATLLKDNGLYIHSEGKIIPKPIISHYDCEKNPLIGVALHHEKQNYTWYHRIQ